ncbi:hypothetical protein VTK26DRAFT_3314 [Humicola hyalothermophila]
MPPSTQPRPPAPADTDTGAAVRVAVANQNETVPLLPSSSSTLSSRSGSSSQYRSLSRSRSTSSSTSPTRIFASPTTTTTTTTPASTRTLRAISFVTALLAALCAGSITSFSLYAPVLQSRLRYSQFRVNGLASAASVAMYVPVPVLGYACDRAGPAPLAVLAAAVFGAGYAGAAAAFVRVEREVTATTTTTTTGWGNVVGLGDVNGAAGVEHGEKWYAVMVAAFVAVGVGTCSLYMAAVATCAKNFGRGRHRGLALAAPIAAFGLSGMWMSQVGSRWFRDERPGGGGEVDAVKYFGFLAVLLFVVGLVGSFGLRIVNEEELVEEAVEELERSGFLEGGRAIFTPGRAENGYGAVERGDPFEEIEDGRIKGPEEEEAMLKKQWVLNAETRRFLSDHTMWCFALGFFFMIGPGEAFINNLGTVIKTLYPPELHFIGKPTSAATHVSIVSITSTVIRLLTGTLTDWLAPSPETGHVQIPSVRGILGGRRYSISRVSFLLFFAVVLSLGLAGLASGLMQNHGERFWIVSGLVGAGYGAVFSLTPIIITVIWGVENFATNWGIVAMFPALGATLWGLVYSAVYQEGAKKPVSPGSGEEQDNFCYGEKCYAPAFWAMAASVWVACGLIMWAWKGRNGWSQRGILV